MKSKPIFGILLLLAMVATSCSTKSGDSDKAMAEGSKDGKSYPMTTCVVSGDKLDSMGKPYVYVYKDPNVKDDPGREIRFCCDGCLPDFKKDPAKYLKKLDEAVAAAKAK